MSATMRATLAKAFGEPNSVLNVAPSHPRPVLNPKSKDLLIHVKACSLSPGDYRRLRGEADGAFPAIQFPYIPGGDVCGVVEAVGDDVQGFKVGDEVRQSPPASSRPCPPSNNHHTHIPESPRGPLVRMRMSFLLEQPPMHALLSRMQHSRPGRPL